MELTGFLREAFRAAVKVDYMVLLFIQLGKMALVHCAVLTRDIYLIHLSCTCVVGVQVKEVDDSHKNSNAIGKVLLQTALCVCVCNCNICRSFTAHKSGAVRDVRGFLHNSDSLFFYAPVLLLILWLL